MTKWLYNFGGLNTEGSAQMRDLLGGKGSNLAEMANLGLPIPPGFTISTDLCATYYENNNQFPDTLIYQISTGLKHIESTSEMEFGNPNNPLLVSVRSGSRASMPGMMDTILNLGLNDKTSEGLADSTGDPRFAYDCYRRFIQMYGDVVLGVAHHEFEDLLNSAKEAQGILLDTALSADSLRELVANYKNLINERAKIEFPQDIEEQLWGAIRAVLDSWMNTRAVKYRNLYDIPDNWGTAVNIQAMVFGNMGKDCATGVAFTRNPSTGENKIYGEYLINAQGEDVVAGIRTPQSLMSTNDADDIGINESSLKTAMPEIFDELSKIALALEQHYGDMQDIEFTIQKGSLWILQTRAGKRTAAAAIQIAVDMVNEGVLDKQTAITRVDPDALEQLLHPRLDPKAQRKILVKGLPASPGAAAGKITFSSDRAEHLASRGEAVVLVRPETSPEDIHGMHAARAILTSRGGMTSHAAVVARGMGRPCITGALDLHINETEGRLNAGGLIILEGDMVTIDGTKGEVLIGEVPTIEPELTVAFATLMTWADQLRHLKVRANAETLADATTAKKFGAEGIGLCRTEHMFFEAERIILVREMILSENEFGRHEALAKLLPIQKQDFINLFEVMAGLPLTIRLLDPPLHEFLPHSENEIRGVADAVNKSFDEVKNRVTKLHENNPMLGHRGCRLGITYPEIYEMQVRAIFEAAIEIENRDHSKIVDLEIMIPLALSKQELKILTEKIDAVAEKILNELGSIPNYIIGTMIELPRAAILAGELAEYAKFFSFGTNDLTQTTLGISRDDAASFIDSYVRQGIFAQDPFTSLDQEGVGILIETACKKSRSTTPKIKLGICGEHGGDPKSIHFFHKCGLDYVSCSPYRVPIARLAAAQAKLQSDKKVSEQS